MPKTTETILYWKDGDSGMFTTGRKFRLANVNAPERHNHGYTSAKRRSEDTIPPGTDVTITTTGKDVYRRNLVTMYANGKNINETLQRRNVLFTAK